MLSDVIQHITGATVPGILGTLLMMLGFIGVVIWAYRLDRRHVAHMSQLPLDSDVARPTNRGAEHG